MLDKTTLSSKLDLITEHWRPRVVAELNGQEVKLAKLEGEFVWHHHDDADELFLVLGGHLRIELRDGVVELGPGEMVVVPRGVEHRPVAEREVSLLLFEPAGVRNTGNVEDARLTAPGGVRL
jgi:mannose-6-phosphate isomerase-like protein (cupin superfamily)